MPKHFQKIASVLFAFIVIVIGNYVIVAQEKAVTGTWKATVQTNKPDEVHVSFERKTGRGRNNHGTNYKISDFQGLNPAQNGNARFSLVREAGTIECGGEFSAGKGAGTFRFTPNANFVRAMKTRGFDFEKESDDDDDRKDERENRIFTAAVLNVTTALADDLLSANFGDLDTGDLFKAAIFKIDSKFMSEMKASGFPNMDMEDLVKARIFKIDAEFVRQTVAMGFGNQPFETLIKMRIFKVTPEFIAEARGEGLTDLDIEDLVKMRIFNIDSDFIRKAKADGVPLKVEKLVEKRIGVWRQ